MRKSYSGSITTLNTFTIFTLALFASGCGQDGTRVEQLEAQIAKLKASNVKRSAPVTKKSQPTGVLPFLAFYPPQFLEELFRFSCFEVSICKREQNSRFGSDKGLQQVRTNSSKQSYCFVN